MFYKVIFSEQFEYDEVEALVDPDGSPVDTQINSYTGLESIVYLNSQMDLLMSGDGMIEGLQICSECTKTYNIENHLLAVTGQLLANTGVTAELIDGSGFSEFVDTNNITEYLN